MFDVYTVLVPLFAVLALLSLLALKLALKDNSTLRRIYQKNQQAYQLSQQNKEESPTKTVLKYMMINFTPIQICAVRRAKSKVILFLSLAIIAIGVSFVPSPYAFVASGTVVYLTYFLLYMGMTRKQEGEQQQGKKNHRQKYLQVSFTILTVILNMAMIGIVFKNYQNTALTKFLGNFAINLALDNFLVRPAAILLIGLPLSKSITIQQHVSKCERQLILLQTYDIIGEKEMLLRPKKMFSPSKIPRSIPLELQIQPKPFQKQALKREEESYERPSQLLKKIKKQKLLPPLNLNLQKTLEDCSLNSLLNSTKKEDQHLENIIQNHKIQKSSEQTQFPIKQKMCSQKMIMINPSQQEPVENEQDIQAEHIDNKPVTAIYNKDIEDEITTGKRGATFHVGDHNGEPLKISQTSSENPNSRQQPLRITLNDNIDYNFEESNSEQEDSDNFKKKRQYCTIDDPPFKNSIGVLQVKEQNNQIDYQIEEIDLNNKRPPLHIQFEQDQKQSKVIKTKKKKKYSHDHNRIIKPSTGEPYLEYLPDMLQRQSKGKKSQSFNRKNLIPNSRLVNSVKRPQKSKQTARNDENIVPQFKIEEL